MKLNFKVKAKHNYKRINDIVQKLPKVIAESTEDILKNIQGYAIRLEKGQNKDGILVEMIDMSTKEVKGRVYADPNKFISNGVSYLFFEYFGTGANAEMEHVGKSKHFIESGYTEWFIPVNKVDRSLKYPIVTIKGAQFYVARGMRANHFLSDSEFYTREQNKEIIIKNLNQMLKEVCK